MAFSRSSQVSIVVPTLNEQDNIEPLIDRLTGSLETSSIEYEIIFIDDHSTDDTLATIKSYPSPVSAQLKKGKAGKAHSLMEGFARARFDNIAMIDADLQYPPEAIPGMLELLESGEADVVVADRSMSGTGPVRLIATQSFRWVFGKLIWRLDADVQSGLKVFRKEIYERADLHPAGWTFDLDFLIQARNGGYCIAGYDIDFCERSAGKAKLKLLSATAQIGSSAIRLKSNPRNYIPFSDAQVEAGGTGFHYKGEKYVTHNHLTLEHTAVERTTRGQRIFMAGVLLESIALVTVNWHNFIVIIITLLTCLYFADLLFSFLLTFRGFFHYSELQASEEELLAVTDWPRYTVFCPLYKEVQVLPQFIAAMKQLDYPKNQLEVFLLLEEDDEDTIAKVTAMKLPDFMKTLVVPDGMPKTKPKACNFGLEQATGEYSVIYDAEDIPEPDQLKKAVVAFGKVSPNVGCIQAKLNYYNWNQNLLTKLFTLEYSLWFNLILTGLQSVGAPIPLGGTSNHFRTRDLRALGGWDPFNVTEDADLGMRITKRGMVTAILDSTTMEEANSQFTNWLKQRSRWIKGYIQTYLVHMRDVAEFKNSGKRTNMIIFQLVIGGKVLCMLVNPLLWALTISYFAFRPELGGLIQSFYLTPIFYLGLISLVLGNFMYGYSYMMGAAKRGQSDLIIYGLAVPIYWAMMSLAAWYALRDLITRPFHWHKTVHGLHLLNDQYRNEAEQLINASAKS